MNRFSVDLPSEVVKYINESRDNFKKFYDRMFEELSARDIDDVLDKTKSHLIDNKKINLSFFEREIIVDLNRNTIYYSGKEKSGAGEDLDKYSSSIVLHYLLNADGTPISGNWISYRELPGGLFYWQTIPGILAVLVKKYGSNGKDFLEKALEIGGKKYTGFKFGTVIYPFKMFPVLLVLNEENDEFGASARVLFDSSAPHYLKTYVVKLIVIYTVNKLCS
jgi:hypothetical protein